MNEDLVTEELARLLPDIGFVYKYDISLTFLLQHWLIENYNIYVLCSLDETTEPKFVYGIKHYKNNTFINVPKYQYSDLYYDYNQCLNDGLLKAVKYINKAHEILP